MSDVEDQMSLSGNWRQDIRQGEIARETARQGEMARQTANWTSSPDTGLVKNSILDRGAGYAAILSISLLLCSVTGLLFDLGGEWVGLLVCPGGVLLFVSLMYLGISG